MQLDLLPEIAFQDSESDVALVLFAMGPNDVENHQVIGVQCFHASEDVIR
jgi:hypothetical protein